MPYWFDVDPERDLVLERVVEVPPEKIWQAWTDPELLKMWFCPRPYMLTECEIEPRRGGKFRTVIESPEGEKHPGEACILEAVKNVRLTWTTMLSAGFRPAASSNLELPFTAIIDLEVVPEGTKYMAVAVHPDDTVRQRHAEMEFEQGWGIALDQMLELIREEA